MATSNTYLFGTNTQIDDFVREAYERIGIIGDELTPYHAESALMSSNLLLTEWMGKGPNAWMREMFMFSLYQGQPIYQLPTSITQVITVIASTPAILNTGGSATSSPVASGSAANCFNPNTTEGCTLQDPNGYISYDYGTGNSNSILYVGIMAINNSSNYTVAIEYSFDTTNWITILQTPETVYNSNQIQWFVIQNSLNARAWRIRETNGATLAIQQINFAQPPTNGPNDRTLTALTASEWMQVGNKMNQGYPSSFFFNQQIQPTLVLWPTPNVTYQTVIYTAYQYPQDVSALFQEFDIPQRYLEALVSELAYRLACKFALDKPDLIERLSQQKEVSFTNAAETDAPYVTLRIQPDFLGFQKYN